MKVFEEVAETCLSLNTNDKKKIILNINKAPRYDMFVNKSQLEEEGTLTIENDTINRKDIQEDFTTRSIELNRTLQQSFSELRDLKSCSDEDGSIITPFADPYYMDF